MLHICICIYIYIYNTSRRKLGDEDDIYDNDDDDDDDKDDHNDKIVAHRYMRRQWIYKTTMVAKTDKDDTNIYGTLSVCGAGMRKSQKGGIFVEETVCVLQRTVKLPASCDYLLPASNVIMRLFHLKERGEISCV